MKTLIKWTCASLLISSASAVTYTVQNLNLAGTDVEFVLLDNTGTAMATGDGVVAIGSFGSDAIVSTLTSGADLAAAFTINALGTINAATEDGVHTGGLTYTGTPTTGSTSSIYTVIGNAATLTASSHFLIYNHGGTFLSSPSEPTSPLVLADDSALLVGDNTVADQFVTVLGANRPAVQLALLPGVAVPEPTSVTLLGLGAFAFVLRRRR